MQRQERAWMVDRTTWVSINSRIIEGLKGHINIEDAFAFRGFYDSLFNTSFVTSSVEFLPPKSGVSIPSSNVPFTAASIFFPSSTHPNWASIIPADRIAAIGFAMPFP
jgi:hypothetical protein